MKEMTGTQIVEILEKTGSKEWNESIAGRLESMRSYFSQDEWTKGLDPYLKSLMGNAMVKIMGETTSHDGVTYLRGFLAALKIITSLPKSVEAQIAGEVSKSNLGPKGDAGY
jgi:hypothetical protein